MADYKHTINLPETDFPMRGNLPKKEPEQLKRWQGLYEKLQNLQREQTFILHDGPPYANGNIHIGHAINKVLKDIIIKSKLLSGYNAPYIPGWDCHGLPIELQVEKKLGKPSHNFPAKAFREKCREYAQSQVEKQKEDFVRLGILGDWDNPYLTMHYKTEADIIRALAKLIENGHLHTGKKPVHWCTDCGSALAEAEVEYQDKTSITVDVKFSVKDNNKLKEYIDYQANYPVSVIIWTTTPWTLPANQGVALNAALDYNLIYLKETQEYIVLAYELTQKTLERYGIEAYDIAKTFKGQALENLVLQHPFYPREVPVILGDHVNLEAGTGAVHTAPGHGQEDYIVGLKYNLPVDNPVDDKGKFLPDTPLFAGEHINKANPRIVEVLTENNKLLHTTKLHHSYPHCWRHKTPLIFRATTQWFISMDQNHLREQALTAIPDVQWVPSWGQERILGMVDKRPDWCISRQRIWGVPIPLLVNKKDHSLHPNMLEIIEKVAQKVEQQGIDAWFDLNIEELIDDHENYYKINDTLDVWFDSGVTHSTVVKTRLENTADMYLEGSDQHRGWFQSSLLSAIGIDQKAPYKTVLTHGFVVDEKGEKMSKSKGNVIGPQAVIKDFGADILRLWVASADYSGEIAASKEIFKRNADAYRRIRNTARFLLANLGEFNPTTDKVDDQDLLPLDRWLINQSYELQQEILKHYETFDFLEITQKLLYFCSITLSSFYLDVIKDRQYTTQKNSRARRSCQTAIYHLLEAMVRWLAPILSFTADEIWQYLPNREQESVFLTTWYPLAFQEDETFTMSFWQEVIQVRLAVNKVLENLRQQNAIGSALDAEVDLYCDETLYNWLEKLGHELHFVLITSDARIHPISQKPDFAIEAADFNGKLWIVAKASEYTKCVRCWHHKKEVGQDKNHPELCYRCITNIEAEGENRLYV